jgi:hypothetical protein
MAISNKSLFEAIKRANYYLKVLEQQGYSNTKTAQTLRAAANKAATGSKPVKSFPTVRPKGGKFTKAQRNKMLKSYQEIQRHKEFFKPLSDMSHKTFSQSDKAQQIRDSFSKKYNMSADMLTDEFFDLLGSDAFQKVYENFGSDAVKSLTDAVKQNPDMLDDLGRVEKIISDYIDNPHRDEFYIEEFEELFSFYDYY